MPRSLKSKLQERYGGNQFKHFPLSGYWTALKVFLEALDKRHLVIISGSSVKEVEPYAKAINITADLMAMIVISSTKIAKFSNCVLDCRNTTKGILSDKIYKL